MKQAGGLKVDENHQLGNAYWSPSQIFPLL